MTRKSVSEINEQLPQNREAERSVLGAILIDETKFDDVSTIVSASDFSAREHVIIFEEMASLRAASTPIDLVTLKNALSTRGRLDDAGGLAYVSSLVDGVPDITRVESYARIVREHSERRRLLMEFGNAQSLLVRAEAGSIDSVVARVIDACVDHRIRIKGDDGRTGPQMVTETMRRIEEAMAHDLTWVPGQRTGFSKFNEYFGGWRPGLHIVGAHSSVGKSALLVQLMWLGVKENPTQYAVYNNLEMTDDDLSSRIASMDSGVPYAKLDQPQLFSKDDLMKVTRAFQRVHEVGERLSTLNISDIGAFGAKLRELKRRGRLGIAYVDYLQLMTDRVEGKRHDVVASVTRKLQQLSLELNVPIFAASQLRRESGDGLSANADSSEIEKAATVLMHITRPYVERDDSTSSPCEAYMRIAKNRRGATHKWRIHYRADLMKFEESPCDEDCPFYGRYT